MPDKDAAKQRTVEEINKEISELATKVKEGSLDIDEMPKKLEALNKEKDELVKAQMSATEANAEITARMNYTFDQIAARIIGQENAKAKGKAYGVFAEMSRDDLQEVSNEDHVKYREMCSDPKKLEKFLVDKVGKRYIKEFGAPKDPPKASKQEASQETKQQVSETEKAMDGSAVDTSSDDHTHGESDKVSMASYARTDLQKEAMDAFFGVGNEEGQPPKPMKPEHLGPALEVYSRYEEEQGVPAEKRTFIPQAQPEQVY